MLSFWKKSEWTDQIFLIQVGFKMDKNHIQFGLGWIKFGWVLSSLFLDISLNQLICINFRESHT